MRARPTFWLACFAALAGAVVLSLPAADLSAQPSQQSPATAQPKKRAAPPPAAEPKRGRQVPVPQQPAPKIEDARADLPPETVQADVSTKNVAVTSSFTGTEIIVFGAVDNSRQPGAESGYYDIVVVVEGTPSRVAVRRKAQHGGIWLNTRTANFENVPNYYAIWSTRPLDEIASEATMIGYEIGFEHVRMTPVGGSEWFGSSTKLPAADANEFREALVRLKTKQGLYVKNDFGVTFIGRSLFRANINLPANVTPGPFETRVYLLRNEKLMSQYDVRVNLEREGVELYVHNFAFAWPFIYGVATVALALGLGLAAASLTGKNLG